MKLKKALLACMVATTFVFTGALLTPAHANSFQGTVWSLTYGGLAQPEPVADPLNETWRIWLGVDTDGYSGSGIFLDQVALKVSSSVVNATLVAAPTGVGAWNLMSGGISAGGCQEAGGGFECADSGITLNSGKGVPINPGNGAGIDYSWVFDVTMANGALFTTSDASIKARFVDINGLKSGALISEPIRLSMVTSVPEPESFAMMLAGLGLLMGALAHRRHSKKGKTVAASAVEPFPMRAAA